MSPVRTEAEAAILDALPTQVHVYDADLRFVYVNEAFAGAHGVAPGLIVGSYWTEHALAPEYMVTVEDLVRAVFESGAPGSQTATWADTPSGDPLVFEHTCVPQIDGTGGVATALCLTVDVTRYARIEQRLRESEARYREVVESQRDLVCRFLPDGTLTLVNSAFCRFFGRSRTKLLGTSFLDLLPAEERPAARANLEALVREPGSVVEEHRILGPDGSVRWQQWTDHAICDEHGRVVEVQREGWDTTERHWQEDLVRDSLREKELLLREVHHRVKNNLQVVSSLLRLQGRELQDAGAQAAFRKTQDRIAAIALVHEILHRGSDFSHVDLGEYLERIADSLRMGYGTRTGDVKIHSDFASVRCGMEQAMACGLIINELVANALEHAFPPGRPGVITLRLLARPGHPYRLVVADDGVGLPGVDEPGTATLGRQLVSTFAEQLGGTLTVRTGRGTRFDVGFTPTTLSGQGRGGDDRV